MQFGELYSIGKASVENGSSTVTGNGSNVWATFLVAGDTYEQAGSRVTIKEVIDDNELVLAYGWPGATQTEQDYVVRADSGLRHEPSEMVGRLRDLLEKLEVFDFARPVVSVIAILNAPDGGAIEGDRYLVGDEPTGAFVNHANEIAEKTATGYRFWEPAYGWQSIEAMEGFQYKYDGTNWTRVSGPVELTVYLTGKPGPGEVLLDRETSEPFTVLAGAPGWVLRAVTTPPAADATFNIMKNDDVVGTALIEDGETHAAFTFDNPVTWAQGDRFRLVSPTPRDAAMTTIDFTAVANR